MLKFPLSSRLLGLVTTAILLAVCAGCERNARDPELNSKPQKVVIGLAGPLTGPQASYGEMVTRGAELRIAELNAQAAETGVHYNLVLGDDQATPRQAVTVAQEFAGDDRIPVVLGHFNSSCSLAAQPIYEAAGVPNISYGSTNDAVGGGSRWTFRTPYKNSLQGRTLARYAQSVGLWRVGILFENEDYGKGLADAFKAAVLELDVEIVAERSYDANTADFRPLFQGLETEHPDAILLAGFFPQLQAAAVQARGMGITTVFLAGDGVGSSRDYIENAGRAAEGTVATGPFLIEADKQSISDFRARFRKEYGEEPDSWAVYTYDAVGVADVAVRMVGADRTAIRDFLAGVDTPQEAVKGLVADIWFDENGDAVNEDVALAVVRDGRYEVITIK